MDAPTHKRHCRFCGDEMIWLPLKNVWGVVYRWRAWCRVHGFSKRQSTDT